jgi:hypothetical protein
MPVEQYSALVDLMPQIEKALEKKGEKISRPNYGNAATGDTADDQEEQRQEESEEEAEVEAGKVESKAKNGKRKKANIEAQVMRMRMTEGSVNGVQPYFEEDTPTDYT